METTACLSPPRQRGLAAETSIVSTGTTVVGVEEVIERYERLLVQLSQQVLEQESTIRELRAAQHRRRRRRRHSRRRSQRRDADTEAAALSTTAPLHRRTAHTALTREKALTTVSRRQHRHTPLTPRVSSIGNSEMVEADSMAEADSIAGPSAASTASCVSSGGADVEPITPARRSSGRMLGEAAAMVGATPRIVPDGGGGDDAIDFLLSVFSSGAPISEAAHINTPAATACDARPSLPIEATREVVQGSTSPAHTRSAQRHQHRRVARELLFTDPVDSTDGGERGGAGHGEGDHRELQPPCPPRQPARDCGARQSPDSEGRDLAKRYARMVACAMAAESPIVATQHDRSASTVVEELLCLFTPPGKAARGTTAQR